MRFSDYTWRPDIDPHEGAEDAIHEQCVPQDEAVSWAWEHGQEAILESVARQRAFEWLKSSQPFFELINIVSRHDREQLRDAIISVMKHPEAPPAGKIPQETKISKDISSARLLAVATDVSKFLESLPRPAPPFDAEKYDFSVNQLPPMAFFGGDCFRTTAPTRESELGLFFEHCKVDDDLSWTSDLVEVVRALRELLFGLSENSDRWDSATEIGSSLGKLNHALEIGILHRVVFSNADGKSWTFGREPNPSYTPINSVVAEWFLEYLTSHWRIIDLAVCWECAGIFRVERRDNVFCSKTCQNRVAYKRKKAIDSRLLTEKKIERKEPFGLERAIWIHHPRFGLGIVEKVTYHERRISVDNGFSFRIPGNQTAEECVAKFEKESGKSSSKWEELVNPRSMHVRVRFLQFVKQFAYGDLFPKNEQSGMTFYSATDHEKLIDLL